MLQAFCELEAEPRDLDTHCHGISFSWRLPDLQHHHSEPIWQMSKCGMPLIISLSRSLSRGCGHQMTWYVVAYNCTLMQASHWKPWHTRL